MSGMDEALRRLVAQARAGTDAWIDGSPAAARLLLAQADRHLADGTAVVSVAAPVGELNLSGLIAQLSGRPDLDGQDDAVLELCSKRLTGAERTALLLWPPHGIGRSALRYLQHAAREAPGLVMVVLGSAPLAAALAEPGFEMLRQRWRAAPAIELPPLAEPVPAAPLPLPPVSQSPTPAPAPSIVPAATLPVPPEPAIPPRAGRGRRPIVWAMSALGAAAVAGFVWLAHGAPGGADGRTIVSGVAMEAALVPLPPLASAPAPAAVAAPTPAVHGTDGLALAALSVRPQLAAPPPVLPLTAALPAATASRPDPALVPSPLVQSSPVQPSLVQAEPLPALRRPEPVRRDTSRLARARSYGPYETAHRYDDAPPDWVRPWVRPGPEPRAAPYLGTYAIDPYGVRIFRYDP